MPNKPQGRFWVPVAAWMAVIFIASSIPGRNVPALFAHQDIVAHIVVYAFLGFLFARALGATTVWYFRRIAAVTVAFCVLYGITDEFHQWFVPGRSVSAADLLFDGIGGVLGVAAIRTGWQEKQ